MALLFAALLVLVALAFSGSMRARLRVQVGKHFFSYRYDYREEWLRFTQTLSAQGGFSAMGQHVVRGLADMVESPGGALWLKDPSGRFFAQAACWNTPISAATEDDGSPQQLVRAADAQLYLSKQRGRNRASAEPPASPPA